MRSSEELRSPEGTKELAEERGGESCPYLARVVAPCDGDLNAGYLGLCGGDNVVVQHIGSTRADDDG